MLRNAAECEQCTQLIEPGVVIAGLAIGRGKGEYRKCIADYTETLYSTNETL